MQLASKQTQAVHSAMTSVFTGKSLYTIGGYAGTGKTTIIKDIVDLLVTIHEKLPMICALGRLKKRYR